MPELTLEMIDEAPQRAIQLAMSKDLRSTARRLRGKDIFFVAAADVMLADKKKATLFLALQKEAEAKAWQLKLKGKKPPALVMGTCTLDTKDGKHVQVAIKKVMGDRKVAIKVARLALKFDLAVQFSDALAKDEDEDEGREAEVEEATLKQAASSLGIDASTIASLIADANLSPAEMAEVQKLLANPKKIEADAEKKFNQLVGG